MSAPDLTPWAGKLVVLKFGGAVAVDPKLEDAFVSDVAALAKAGARVVLVHGGGKRVSEIMARLGQEPVFVDGHRVTTDENMAVVEWILSGEANQRLVGKLNHLDVKAVGLTGRDGDLFVARPKDDHAGRTGLITAVNPAPVHQLLQGGFLPVVSPVSAAEDGGAMNVNADIAAGHLAGALKADLLVYFTDTEGVFAELGNAETLLRDLPLERVEAGLADGTFTGGMIPKLQGACEAAAHGCPVRITGGTSPGALLRAMADPTLGTTIAVTERTTP